ncbi:MAG TPA: DUF2062 domain-containing protein [Burkholderiaceae bacterium]|nr:DUF2062 domain-containing protein [Burkholderiaceae bacterium]
MKSKLSAWLASHWPTQESLQGNRWLGWLGPRLFHPNLWRPRRKTLATGLAIGVFFGFLIPLAQIPASAVLATVLRANLPAAMASTLVTNPVTFGPVYYVAYKLGVVLVGPADAPAKASPVQPPGAADTSVSYPPPGPVAESGGGESSWSVFWGYITGVGKPLAVGLVIFAICGSALVYCVANRLWVMQVRRKRRQRLASHQG